MSSLAQRPDHREGRSLCIGRRGPMRHEKTNHPCSLDRLNSGFGILKGDTF
jgi:hypothetical protein